MTGDRERNRHAAAGREKRERRRWGEDGMEHTQAQYVGTENPSIPGDATLRMGMMEMMTTAGLTATRMLAVSVILGLVSLPPGI